MRVHAVENARHLVIRASEGELLPDSLVETLRAERVVCGWMRASGVLTDISLRAYDPEIRGLGGSYVIAGPAQALAVDGCVGVVDGAPSCSLRAVLARDTDRGLETLAGEIESARVVALDVLVTAFDDLALARSLDARAGIWMFGAPGAAPPRRAGTGDAGARSSLGWSAALEASADAGRGSASRARSSAQSPSTAIPTRPARPGIDLDAPVPEAGDVVDHFAFGRCDVLKSDGDRLHLKIHKDGRVREIALEMLRVIRLPGELPGDDRRPRRFKLERRI